MTCESHIAISRQGAQLRMMRKGMSSHPGATYYNNPPEAQFSHQHMKIPLLTSMD